MLFNYKNIMAIGIALSVASVVQAKYVADDDAVIDNYVANSTGITFNHGPFGSERMEAKSSLTFTGYTQLNAKNQAVPRNIVLSAPKINMESVVSINNNGYNRLTFENAIVNFDKATWNSNAKYQGPMAFAGNSGVQITDNSLDKTTPLIQASQLSGNVNLVVDNGAIAEGETEKMCLVNDSAAISDLAINNNAMYDIKTTATQGTYDITQRTAADIQDQGYTKDQAGILKNMMGVKGNQFLDDIATLVQMGKKESAQEKLNGMRPATNAAQTVAFDTALATIRAVYNHIVPANDEGILAGMIERNHLTPWVEGILTRTHNDMENQGFESHQVGMAMGFDAQIKRNTILGLGYSQTTGRFKSDLSSKTDLKSYMGFLYGAFKPSQWFVAGMMSYGRMKYDNKGTKWDADVFGTQGGVGYEWGWIDIGAGLRYMLVSSDKYKNAYGTDVKAKTSDILTGIVGARVQRVFYDDNCWALVPSAHVAGTYDFVQAKDKTNISYNGAHLYTFEGDSTKRLGAEVGAGLKLTNGPFEATASYEGAFKKKVYTNGGYLTVKYHF